MRCILAVFAFAVFVLAANAFAAGSATTQPAYVPNQLLVKLAPGLSEAERDATFEKIGAKLIRPVALANTYLVELVPTRGETVQSAITRASTVEGIVMAGPNYIKRIIATPNDPEWPKLWGMRMINMEKAWDVTRGSASVIVAVLDTGFSLDHPDLVNRYLPGRDTADGDDDPSESIPEDEDEDGMNEVSHGTHVAGIIAAQGNNAQGVVGVCWDAVKILPVKVMDATKLADNAACIDGMEFAKQQGAQVVNMSYGSYYYDPFEHQKIKELYAAGIILVAGAGNDSTSVPFYPACYPETISVAALDEDESPTIYSNYGPEIDIAAPGGEGMYEDDPAMILSTGWSAAKGNHYAYLQGTSMATPHVSGAAALLIASGIPPSQVTGMLYRAARAPKTGALDPIRYGHGVLDVFNALQGVAEINILSPKDADVLDTTTPQFKVSTYLVKKDSIKVYLDFVDTNKDGIPDDLTDNIVLSGSAIDSDPNVMWDADTGLLTFNWPTIGQAPLSSGTHTICVLGESTSGASAGTVKDWAVFFIRPHVVPAGRHLFSIPYPLSNDVTPFQLFGSSDFRLARYVPSLNTYATINYPSGNDEVNAWPSNPGVHPHGDLTDTPPAGLGFFIELANDTPIVLDGIADKTRAYDITLTRGSSGWNMIGNPFPFPVPWESVKVIYRGMTLTLRDAVAAGWIRPQLYRYTKSGYTFQTAPEAVLVPWEGHWVRILPDADDHSRDNDTMVLMIPPIESSTIVEATKSRAASTGESWSLRLQAKAGEAVDMYNFAGIDSRANEGYDLLDVEEPPMLDNYVQLSFVKRDSSRSAARYASDYRPSLGTGKTWDFDVKTDMPNKEVQISWPDIASVPKNCRLVLEDLDSGSRVYMRTRSSYKYNSGPNAGVRRFRMYAEPSDAGSLLITNVAISQTRGSSISINYTISRDARVEVRVRDNRNKVVRTLSGNTTRAAGINSVTWDCILDGGNQAPSGLYLAEIVATGPDGEVAKTVRPIMVR